MYKICWIVCCQVKVSSPDYANMKKEDVLADFMLRIEHYQERYQPLDEERESDLSFMKIYNTGEKVLVHKHEGHIQSRIVYYLMNIHIVPRTIYLTRHGESLMNIDGRIGGDSDLSERGNEYAKALADYISSQNIQVIHDLFNIFYQFNNCVLIYRDKNFYLIFYSDHSSSNFQHEDKYCSRKL